MERRRAPRTKTSREVIGRIPATPITATIFDFSLSGCLAQTESPLIQRGATILLDLSETDAIAGQVVWREDDRFGIEFHEHISSETLLRLTEADADRPGTKVDLKDRFGRRLTELGARIRIAPRARA